LGVTIVPLQIHFGSQTFRDGIDITTADFFRRLSSRVHPRTSPPPLSAFYDVFSTLTQETDQILVIGLSGKLSETIRVARRAAERFMGRYRIEVVDSTLISVGLGMLVTMTAEAAAQDISLDELLRFVRGLIPHIYIAFFVETLDYLERGGRLGQARSLIDQMLNIKPLFILEDGEIQPLDQVRTRMKAIERLEEFITEFARVEEIVILQDVITTEAQELAERIKLVFPDEEIGFATYGPVLATHLGPGAIGVVVYEGM
jgi:DegV family protein with EDD domain